MDIGFALYWCCDITFSLKFIFGDLIFIMSIIGILGIWIWIQINLFIWFIWFIWFDFWQWRFCFIQILRLYKKDSIFFYFTMVLYLFCDFFSAITWGRLIKTRAKWMNDCFDATCEKYIWQREWKMHMLEICHVVFIGMFSQTFTFNAIWTKTCCDDLILVFILWLGLGVILALIWWHIYIIVILFLCIYFWFDSVLFILYTLLMLLKLLLLTRLTLAGDENPSDESSSVL